jgi:hypothetical protein
MNESELIATIIHTAYTKGDITRRLRMVRGYLEHTYYSTDTHLSLEEFLDSKHATPDDIEAINKYGDAFFQSFNKETMYKLVEAMNEKIKALPSVNIYIPYEATMGEVVKMGKWFRKNVDPNMLVELHTDPTLLGGCAFAWQGIYRDYSLRHYMYKRRGEIAKIISKYVQETG